MLIQIGGHWRTIRAEDQFGVCIGVVVCVCLQFWLSARTRRTEAALAMANAAAEPSRTIHVKDEGGLEYTIEDHSLAADD